MKFKEYVEKINERRIPGFDGYARNKRRSSGFSRHITSKSTVGNPRLMIPRVGDTYTSPKTKKRNDKMRYVLKAGKFSDI